MEVQVKVSKETYELGQGVAKLVADVKEQLASGKISADRPIITAIVVGQDIMNDLVPALDGTEKIKDELKDPVVFASTAALVGAAILGALLK